MAALRERLAALPWNDPLRPAIVAQLQDLRRGRVDIIEPEDGVQPRGLFIGSDGALREGLTSPHNTL